MSKFLSRRFDALNAYVPGEQPIDRYIKLNTNESPYPPAPGVIAAASESEARKLNLYPNPDGTLLLQKLAETYGVEQECVIIGNGSDELLAFAFLAFCDGERPAIFPDITYGFYPVYAELYGVPYRQIPLKDDFTINPADYLDSGANVILANPNAPTGIALALCDIEEIAKRNSDRVVLIDEAYVEFGAESAVPLIKKYENLLVMHTYSKSRSMAGARLAYAISQRPIIEDMRKMKYSFNPYNVNSLTQAMGIAALDERGYYEKNCAEIIATRAYTQARLRKLGFSMTESAANFVFARHPEVSGEKLYSALKQRGILVRHFDKPRISDFLRITIGTTKQMDAALAAIEAILKEAANAKK